MAATLLITGGCGFVGSRIAKSLLRGGELSQQTGVAPPRITVLDSFIRSGSERNRPILECLGLEVVEGDLRDRSLIDSLPACDWVIDCAANPSVLAGLSPQSSSLELVDHNLGGTIHLLEYCKRHRAGLVLVSTSRIYSAGRLSAIPHRVRDSKIDVDWSQVMSDGQFTGLTEAGIGESFSVEPPLSLYGTTKLASEWLAMEYANAFGFPVWIDRCGVLAGAGQFGKADQGIVAYWMHRYLYGHPLKFIGFEGSGAQVRDCLHPEDLARLIAMQIRTGKDASKPNTVNISGGIESSFSLIELHEWCQRRWGDRVPGGPRSVSKVLETRPFDAPWIVLDSSLAKKTWGWEPTWSREAIWDEIATHAEENPDWLQISGGLG